MYDCLETDNSLIVQDRGSTGHGHGWAGINMVFWNCEAATIICQGQWDTRTGTNYAIGCVGEKLLEELTKGRPDGIWVSQGKHVRPESLYEYQFRKRRSASVAAVPESHLKSIFD